MKLEPFRLSYPKLNYCIELTEQKHESSFLHFALLRENPDKEKGDSIIFG